MEKKIMLNSVYVYAIIYIIIFLVGWRYSYNELTRKYNEKRNRHQDST
jgi:uncharacterized membrane protein